MSANKNTTKVVTGVVRLSYANVWEPVSINGGTPKYSVSLIIPKSDTKTIEAINARPAEDLFYRLRNARLNYYRSLSAWKHFGKGWTNRVMDLKFVG